MKLTQVERRVLRYHGQPAETVAIAERLTIHQVIEIRLALRRRGVVPDFGGSLPDGPPPTCTEDQLSFDHMMRANRAPRAADVELGDTTSTDPGGW